MNDLLNTQGKTHMNELNPRPFIRTSDVSGGLVLTIRDWGTREFYDAQERGKVKRGVLYFQETEKYLIVNPTQTEQIAAIMDSEFIEDWTGRKIELYVAQVRVGNKTEPGVRVRKPRGTGLPAPSVEPVRAESTRTEDAPTEWTRQRFFEVALKELNAPPDVVNEIARNCGGDYARAIERVRGFSNVE